MFFKLCNAPATLQAMMNDIFWDYILEGWIVIYMENILIFLGNLEEHQWRMRKVIEWLREYDLYLKAEKCKSEVKQVKFLEAVIWPREVAMDSVKLDGLWQWPSPITVKQVQSFLRFGNFYRWFIQNYSHVVKPLIELMQKEQKYVWTLWCQQAFDTLKQWFQKAPILWIPDPSEPFQIKCDTLKVVTGAVLWQKGSDGLWHPCSHLFKIFLETELNYQIYD